MVDMVRDPRRFVAALLIGIAGTVAIAGALLLLGETLPHTVPALLLLLPVALSSTLGSWRIGVPTAVLAALVYSLAFVPPIGGVSVDVVEDLYVLVAFLAVAVAIGVTSGRPRSARSDQLLDDERAMLLRSVSHDLRTPLGTIQTVSAELAANPAYDAATQRELMELVADEADRLDRIVANLLSLSRAQAGTFQPEAEPTPVRSLVEAATTRLARTTTRPVVAAVDGDLPEVLADPVQVDQVLANLLENAVRHAPGATPIRVTAERDGGFVAISVRDEGPGLDGRADGSAAVVPGDRTGNGLGLTVCRAIVEAHGGRVELGDAPGRGAVARFTLPVAGASHVGNMAETR